MFFFPAYVCGLTGSIFSGLCGGPVLSTCCKGAHRLAILLPTSQGLPAAHSSMEEVCQRKRRTVQSLAAGLQQMLILLRLPQPEQGSRRGQRAEKYILRRWEASQSSFFSLHFASVWCWPQGTIPKLYLKPRSGDVLGRKPTVPLPEE